MDLVIYGAKGLALGIYEAIRHLYPERNIRCFLVTNRQGNAEVLSGTPVLALDDFAKELSEEEKEKIEILIAVPEDVMPAIEKSLDEQGLYYHVRMTSMRWAKLMGYHYSGNQSFRPLGTLPVGFHKPELQVFMAKFFRDRPLNGKYDLPEWIMPIQVGAALCKERVAEVLTVTDSISQRRIATIQN